MAFATRQRAKDGEIRRKSRSSLMQARSRPENRSINFFEKQAVQCRAQAKGAFNEADRESWLDMALRWERMYRPNHDNGPRDGNYTDRHGRTRIKTVRGLFS